MDDATFICRCLPVQLNNPWTMEKQPNLPMRKYADIPGIPIPWFLATLKIALIIVTIFYMKLESTQPQDLLGFGICQVLASFCELMVVGHLLVDTTVKSQKDYDEKCGALIALLVLRAVFLLVGIGFSAYVNNVSYIYLSATIGSIAIEIILCRRLEPYYRPLFKELEDGLIEDVKTSFGRDHEVGQDSLCEFYTETDTEGAFWIGTTTELRGLSLQPQDLYWQLKDDVQEYFVHWDAYADINERIKQDFNIMEGLVEMNTELRNDLKKQTRLICQLRRKFRGPTTDCSDVNQIPPSLAGFPLWCPVMAEGLFLSTEGITDLFVKLGDYRQMADHAVSLRNSISLLEHEKQEFNNGLLERKRILIELMESMINGEMGNNEDVFELIRIDDVD